MSTAKNQKYPLSMIVFHSLIAILMIAALVVGWMGNKELMGLHKSLGALVLILAVVRLINRFRFVGKMPESVNAKGSIQYIAEKAVHGLLMLTMLGIPLVGWLMSNAKGYPVSVFGLFNLPTLIAKDLDFAEQLTVFHELGANVFFILLLVHVLGGLVHLVKEKHNVFTRMKP